jgi:site-specific DNA-methyltransferase (adenine-specific)
LVHENEVVLGDCLEVLKRLPDASVDSVVTDPPYGLGTREPEVEEVIAYLQGASLDTSGDFMGKPWEIPSVAIWKECFRVLKPGGHLLSFGGTRTFDLISLGIRAAGFENRDTIANDFGCPVLTWRHGMGFPKSLNIGKAIDKAKGVEREVVGHREGEFGNKPGNQGGGEAETALWLNKAPTTKDVRTNASSVVPVTVPATPEAIQYEGWGTALKPSWEPILVFRKPIEGSTVAENVLKYGTGGMNIDATRVKHSSPEDFEKHKAMVDHIKEKGGSMADSWKNSSDLSGASEVKTAGRWPPNVVMTHVPDCKRVGTNTVKAPVINRFTDGMKPFGEGAGHPYESSGGGTEEVAVWDCIPGCPVKALDEQSGESASGAMRREVPAYEGESSTGFLRGRSGPSNQHGDSGGASRFFPQFEQDQWECAEGCPVRALDEQSGNLSPRGNVNPTNRSTTTGFTRGGSGEPGLVDYKDSGGASRFFPQFEGQAPPEAPFFYTGKATKREATLDGQVPCKHPTRKPLALMKWLVQLVTPKGGLVLDPFCGSGTTCVAAVDLGMNFIGIEKDPAFHEDAVKRVGLVFQKEQEVQGQRDMFDLIMGDEDVV